MRWYISMSGFYCCHRNHYKYSCLTQNYYLTVLKIRSLVWVSLILNWGIHKLLEKAMAPHSSTLAWKISWTEEPGGLQCMGSLRVGHDWVTSLSLFTFMHWRRTWQPTPVFLPGESQGQEPDELLSMGSHRVGHGWHDLAEAVAAAGITFWCMLPYGWTSKTLY